jgi:transcription factor TFIIIB component B''
VSGPSSHFNTPSDCPLLEKGGHVFKPVAKPRNRPSNTPSRQTSEAADTRSSMTSTGGVAAAVPVFATPDLISPSTTTSERTSLSSFPHEERGSSLSFPPASPPKVVPSFTSSHHIRRSSNNSSIVLPIVSQLPSSNVPTGMRPAPPTSVPSISAPVAESSPTMTALSVDASAIRKNLSLQQAPSIPPSASEPITLNPLIIMDTYARAGPSDSISAQGFGSTSTGPVPKVSVNTGSTSNVPQRRRKLVKEQELLREGGTGKDELSRRIRSLNGDADSNGSLADQSPEGDGVVKKKRSKRSTGKEGTKHSKKAKTNTSVPPRKPPKARVPTSPSFDPDADPGEELDPTAVTMAALCKDTGQGRISSKAAQIQSNHTAWKASNREKRSRMKCLMQSKKYGLGDGDTSPSRSSTANAESTRSIARENTKSPSLPSSNALVVANIRQDVPAVEDESGHGFDYSQSLSTNRFNVQVRIGPNGETIIDEESLFVDRNEEQATETYTHVEESDTTKFVNSGTYGKKYRGTRWSAEETELFYDVRDTQKSISFLRTERSQALAQFGENYELISYVLPGRDRTSCKNKFKAEDKKNPNRITYCLDNRIPYGVFRCSHLGAPLKYLSTDIQTLSRMTGKDFSGPTPEIRAPTPLTLIEKPRETTTEPSAPVRKHNSTLRIRALRSGKNAEEEILGDAADFDQYKDD